MTIEYKDDSGRIVTINAVPMMGGARITIEVKTNNRTRTIITSAASISQFDADLLAAGLGF